MHQTFAFQRHATACGERSLCLPNLTRVSLIINSSHRNLEDPTHHFAQVRANADGERWIPPDCSLPDGLVCNEAVITHKYFEKFKTISENKLPHYTPSKRVVLSWVSKAITIGFGLVLIRFVIGKHHHKTTYWHFAGWCRQALISNGFRVGWIIFLNMPQTKENQTLRKESRHIQPCKLPW